MPIQIHRITHKCGGDGCERKWKFDVEPYIAGRTSGPPENCYPPEGGFADIAEETPNLCECGFHLSSDEFLEVVYLDWEKGTEQFDDSKDSWDYGD
jgi:hypothetical protein